MLLLTRILTSVLHGFSSPYLITNLFQYKGLPPTSDHQGDSDFIKSGLETEMRFVFTRCRPLSFSQSCMNSWFIQCLYCLKSSDRKYQNHCHHRYHHHWVVFIINSPLHDAKATHVGKIIAHESSLLNRQIISQSPPDPSVNTQMGLC